MGTVLTMKRECASGSPDDAAGMAARARRVFW
jgi:hypothetical protein